MLSFILLDLNLVTQLADETGTFYFAFVLVPNDRLGTTGTKCADDEKFNALSTEGLLQCVIPHQLL